MAERRAPRLTPEAQAYTRAVADVRRRLVDYSAAAYSAVGVDDPGMAALVDRVVPAVEAAQIRVANLTAVHLARQAGAKPLDVDPELVTRGRGVDPETVYQRPIIAARSVLAEHKPFVDAKAAGARRLEQLVTTDVQMAKIRQADRSLRATGRERYRRVPKGESTCALCRIAATQPYSVGDLLPIHPGCDCGVDEIPAGLNLDDLLDVEALLESTHAKVEAFTDIADRGGRAVDYRKLLITEEHGEIGPLLAWDGQKFTGESQIHDGHPAAKESKADIARRQLPGLEESLANLRDEGMPEDSPQVEWHKQQIERYRERLADQPDSGQTLDSGGSRTRNGMTDNNNTPDTSTDAVQPPMPPADDRAAATGDEDPHDRLDRLFSDQTAQATPRQRSAAKRWQGMDRFYERVQEAVGGSGDPEAVVVAQQLSNLAKPLPEETELWRGVRSIRKTFGVGLADLALIVGRNWIEERFMGATVSLDQATPEFTHPGPAPAILYITARAGAPAVWIPPLGDPKHARQSELLFMDGVRVRILGVDMSGEIPVIRMEVT